MLQDKRQNSFIGSLVLLASLLLIIVGCARVVAPGGGPIDEDPPEVIRSEPPNYSTNYDGSDIRIYFDEFVELHNLRQKMLVSPPMENMPEVSIRRRSIIMSIEEELMDNTTYNFFFGDAIRDITEGNVKSNFQFIVSTGDYVDSLSVRGEVINAFDRTPAEEVYVMMYDNIFDSVPYKELPVYISRTCEQGQFEITNMREGEYLMFALEDLTHSYKYEQPDERIAFLDSLVVPEYVETVEEPEIDEEAPLIDEDLPETGEQPDTITEPGIFEPDIEEPSIDVEDKPTRSDPEFYRLFLFQEADTVQRISSKRFTPPGRFTFEFRVPFDSVYVEEYKEPFDGDWKYKEFTKGKDSMLIWLDNVERDSLYLKVWDKDHLIDTVKESIKPREGERRRAEDPELSLTPNVRPGQTFSYFRDFVLTANNPIKDIDTDRIEVFINDSIPVESQWECFGTAERRFRLDKTFEQDTTYNVIIPDSTFTDIFGLSNADTLDVSFNTSSAGDYGMILVDLTLPEEGENYILQLLNNEDEPIEEKFINESDEYRFPNLSPGGYSFKVIHDKHKTGKWNTGNYLEGVQPEPVYVLDEEIEVRQNWEHEVVWDIVK